MTEIDSDCREEIALAALGSFSEGGPQNIKRVVSVLGTKYLQWNEEHSDEAILSLLTGKSTELTRAAKKFRRLVRTWDRAQDERWASGTRADTQDRRNLIYRLLDLPEALRQKTSEIVPIMPPRAPISIAADHELWYTSFRSSENDFYWRSYRDYLDDVKEFPSGVIHDLDVASTEVLKHISDPYAERSYAARGLVVGYVQSGKTTNFTAVIAKAVDAGYRLIIVLAGMTKVLRLQTQRRLDKELIGEPFVEEDEYEGARDRAKFIKHAWPESEEETCQWVRLTTEEDDYARLAQGLPTLHSDKERERKATSLGTFFDKSPARIMVVKKHKDVLRNLVLDIQKVVKNKPSLRDIAALVVDDESDQASVNTAKPKLSDETRERTQINKQITDLLKIFPRGQYVAYTATPFANVFIDPEDSEDLFPRDFIVSLPQPDGYMGIKSFVDLGGDELSRFDNNNLKRGKHVRILKGSDKDSNNLKTALAAFVLTAAVKLYRLEVMRPAPFFPHHTMLVNTDPGKDAHSEMKKLVLETWAELSPLSPKGQAFLKETWEKDIGIGVEDLSESTALPLSYSKLALFLGAAVRKIMAGGKICLVVNSGLEKDAPSFETEDCWKIIVGGYKLSRGYTVEGLTISYFRRVAKANDTMMQMSRWFGFRPHYEDLVRLYLGAPDDSSNSKKVFDLYQHFVQLAAQEEKFREQISMYAEDVAGEDGLRRARPSDIPPLVQSVLGTTPTSRTKMYNTELLFPGLGDEWWMPLTYSSTKKDLERSALEVRKVLAKIRQTPLIANIIARSISAGDTVIPGKVARNRDVVKFFYGITSLEDVEKIIRASGVFSTNKSHENFFKVPEHRILLQKWHFIAPLLSEATGKSFRSGSVELRTSSRKKNGRHLGTVSSPAHRRLAHFLRGRSTEGYVIECVDAEIAALRDSNFGLIILYPVDVIDDTKTEPTMAFEILFPATLPRRPMLRVRVPEKKAAAIISKSSEGEV